MSKDEITLLENIVLKIIGWGVGGVLCLIGAIVMALHTYLHLTYSDWLITGLTSLITGFILIMIHTIFNFILKLKTLKTNK